MSWNNITPASMLVSVETRLRELVSDVHNRPLPISAIIPLLNEAANEIDRLREFEFMYKSVSK